jgi:hypothetical protein
MRFARNFHPEWGYLAPAPNFMRTARIVVVATAIGATAGAGVVLSLVERPTASPMADAGNSVVVVHSLVQPAEAAVPAQSGVTASVAAPLVVAPVTTPPAASAQAPASTQLSAEGPPAAALPPIITQAAAPASSDSITTATPAVPASVAALAEVPPAGEVAPAQPAAEAALAPDQIPPPKKVLKRHRTADYEPLRGEPGVNGKKSTSNNQGLAPVLRRLFSARTGSSYYPN